MSEERRNGWLILLVGLAVVEGWGFWEFMAALAILAVGEIAFAAWRDRRDAKRQQSR